MGLPLPITLTIVLLCALDMRAVTSAECPEGFVNFGDSLTDTGNYAYLNPYNADCQNFPYGETFFGKPFNRFSNGRLVPDFFSLAFNKPFLDPCWAHGSTYDHHFGINCAIAGATAVSSNINPWGSAVYPFQVDQFRSFLTSLHDAEIEPNYSESKQWLFTIEIGGNDLIKAIQNGAPNPDFGQIAATVIPAAVGGIVETIKELYWMGARQFLVFGVPAQGCATMFLYSIPDSPAFPRDNLGCIIPINNLALVFNGALLAGLQTLRPTLYGANIAGFDYYRANMEIISRPGTYGFRNVFSACCGAPGSNLNYNPAVKCGHPSSNNCADPGQFVDWDGVHFTDAFYKVIATFALNGHFTDGGMNYASTCNLDFSKF